jgi:GNAT superfamily N-acetyltransferase/predicted ABC-type ATPase
VARWVPEQHPRGRKGLFITTGMHVRLPGGLTGHVTNVNAGNRLGIQQIEVAGPDGRRIHIPADQIEEVAPPRGKAYDGNGNVIGVGDNIVFKDQAGSATVKSVNKNGSITVGNPRSATGDKEVDPGTVRSWRDTDPMPPSGRPKGTFYRGPGSATSSNPTTPAPRRGTSPAPRRLRTNPGGDTRGINAEARQARQPSSGPIQMDPVPATNPDGSVGWDSGRRPVSVGDPVTIHSTLYPEHDGQTAVVSGRGVRGGIKVRTMTGEEIDVRPSEITRATPVPSSTATPDAPQGMNPAQSRHWDRLQRALQRAQSSGRRQQIAIAQDDIEQFRREMNPPSIAETNRAYERSRQPNAARDARQRALLDEVRRAGTPAGTTTPAPGDDAASTFPIGTRIRNKRSGTTGVVTGVQGDQVYYRSDEGGGGAADWLDVEPENMSPIIPESPNDPNSEPSTNAAEAPIPWQDIQPGMRIQTRWPPNDPNGRPFFTGTVVRKGHRGTNLRGERQAFPYVEVKRDDTGDTVPIWPEDSPASAGPGGTNIYPAPDAPESVRPGARADAPLGADGYPISVGDRITVGGRTGTVTRVRPGAGRGGADFVVFRGEDTGRDHTAVTSRVTHAETPGGVDAPGTPGETATPDVAPSVPVADPNRDQTVAPFIGDAVRAAFVQKTLDANQHLATDVRFHADTDSTFTPERTALQDAILKRMYAEAADVPNNRQSLMSGGLGGAGKSYVLSNHPDIDHSQYLTINPDVIKDELINAGMAPDIPGLTPLETAGLIHEESSKMAMRLARMAYLDGKNLIWDITMSKPSSVQDRIDMSREAGYSIKGVFVSIPAHKSVESAMQRWADGLNDFNNGKGLGGRYVPPDLILGQADAANAAARSRNEDTFSQMRAKMDDWELWDNSKRAFLPDGSVDPVNNRDAVLVTSKSMTDPKFTPTADQPNASVVASRNGFNAVSPDGKHQWFPADQQTQAEAFAEGDPVDVPGSAVPKAQAAPEAAARLTRADMAEWSDDQVRDAEAYWRVRYQDEPANTRIRENYDEVVREHQRRLDVRASNEEAARQARSTTGGIIEGDRVRNTANGREGTVVAISEHGAVTYLDDETGRRRVTGIEQLERVRMDESATPEQPDFIAEQNAGVLRKISDAELASLASDIEEGLMGRPSDPSLVSELDAIRTEQDRRFTDDPLSEPVPDLRDVLGATIAELQGLLGPVGDDTPPPPSGARRVTRRPPSADAQNPHNWIVQSIEDRYTEGGLRWQAVDASGEVRIYGRADEQSLRDSLSTQQNEWNAQRSVSPEEMMSREDQSAAGIPNPFGVGDRIVVSGQGTGTVIGVRARPARSYERANVVWQPDDGSSVRVASASNTLHSEFAQAPDLGPSTIPSEPRDPATWRRWGDRAQEIADSPGPTLEDIRALGRGIDGDGNPLSADQKERNRQIIIGQLEEMYNGANGSLGRGQATVEITGVSTYYDEGSLSGNIVLDGQRIGSFSRTFNWNTEGQGKEVHNSLMRINPQFQGQGIADDLYRRQENWAIQNGFKRITVHANIDIGGYAWASKGYDFKSRSGAKSALSNAIDKMQRMAYRADGDRKSALDNAVEMARARYRDMNNGGPAITSFELSQLGRKNAYTVVAADGTSRLMWPGKEAMLGSGWQGVKRLTAPRANSGTSARPNAAAGVTTTSNGIELRPGMKIIANGRRGRVTSVRPTSGVAIFMDEDGAQRSAQIRRMEAVETSPRRTFQPIEMRSAPRLRVLGDAPRGTRVVTIPSGQRGTVTRTTTSYRNGPMVHLRLDDGRPVIASPRNLAYEAVADKLPVYDPKNDNFTEVPAEYQVGQHVMFRDLRSRHGVVTGLSRRGDGTPIVTFRQENAEATYDIPIVGGYSSRITPYVPPPLRPTAVPSRVETDWIDWGSRAREIAQQQGPDIKQMMWDFKNGGDTPERRAELVRQLTDLYNAGGGLGRGNAFKVDNISIEYSSYNNTLGIVGTIRTNTAGNDTGYRVGGFTRHLMFDDPSDPFRATEMHNDLMSIDRAYRGQGVAMDLYRRQENWAIANGVKKITIHANIDVGGYAWARAGYDYQTRDGAAMHIRRALLNGTGDTSETADSARLELRAMQRRMSESDWYPTPFEVSRVGWTPNAGNMWPGKRWTLGTDWMAVKKLRPNNARDMSETTGIITAALVG